MNRPTDPATRVWHRERLVLLGLVFVGGVCGTWVRAELSNRFPVAADAWPWTTFWINVSGAFVLGVLLGLLVVLGLAFGSVAAPAFSSVYRSVPGDKIARATPALFMTVQLGAATGASVAALLMDRLAAGTALTAGYLSIAVLTVLARAIARALPGPPAP